MSDEHAGFRGALDRLARLEQSVAEIAGAETEPQVLYLLRDLIKPGQPVFDVGANFGFLSIAMSHRAGPRSPGKTEGNHAYPLWATFY